MILIIIQLVFIHVTSEKRWCDDTQYGLVTFREEKEKNECNYKYSLDKIGFTGFSVDYQSNRDIFSIYENCCSPSTETKDMTNNKIIIQDTKDNTNKTMKFMFIGDEFRRTHTFLTINQTAVNSSWFIDTNNIISKSTITLEGIRKPSLDYPVYIEASTFNFNLTSPGVGPNKNENEIVFLNYTWGFSPYVNVSGNIAIKLIDDFYDGFECQYRYTKEIGKGEIIQPDNPNYKTMSICPMGKFERIAICEEDRDRNR